MTDRANRVKVISGVNSNRIYTRSGGTARQKRGKTLITWQFQQISAVPVSKIEEALTWISRSRLKELSRRTSQKSRSESMIGEMLLRQMLSERLCVPEGKPEIIREDGKKPYLAENEAQFSISHSEDWVMAAVASRPIGVDIEKIRPIRKSMERALFTIMSLEDRQYIEAADKETERTRRLFELWTRKEAVVKCIGTGIASPQMKETAGTGNEAYHLTLADPSAFPALESGNAASPVRLRIWTPKAPDGYCCAICECEEEPA